MKKVVLFILSFFVVVLFVSCRNELFPQNKNTNCHEDTSIYCDGFHLTSGPDHIQWVKKRDVEYEICIYADDSTTIDTICLNEFVIIDRNTSDTILHYQSNDTTGTPPSIVRTIYGQKSTSYIIQTGLYNDNKHSLSVSYSISINGKEIKRENGYLESKRVRSYGFRHIGDVLLLPFILVHYCISHLTGNY